MKKLAASTWIAIGSVLLLAAGVAAWLPVGRLVLAARSWPWGNAREMFDGPALAALLGTSGLIAIAATKERTRDRQHTAVRSQTKPWRWWSVVLIAVGIAVISGTALTWLMGPVARAFPRGASAVDIDAVRTGLTLGVGLLGALLALAARKQWLAERAQWHIEADTAEQRVTELYAAAAEQLSSEHAPVRLAGLYALHRLGQRSSAHRQSVVNLFCAYLRMPCARPEAATAVEVTTEEHQFDHAGHERPSSAPTTADSRSGAAEMQVRLTAQRLLTLHLYPGHDRRHEPSSEYFWSEVDLDLTGATLFDWDFTRCRVRRGIFNRVSFHGETRFDEAFVHKDASFDKAFFHDHACFAGVTFHERTVFNGARARMDCGDHSPEWPPGWTISELEQVPDHYPGRWGELVRPEPSNEQPRRSAPGAGAVKVAEPALE